MAAQTKPVREILHSGWYEFEPLAELRSPKRGEWFFGGYMDFPKQATQDIPNEYWVLKPVPVEAKINVNQV